MSSIATNMAVMAPAFLAGAAVLSSHIVLGREVLSRGIIFIDLAIAQFAALGLIVASAVFGLEPHGIAVQLIAMAGALLGAGILSITESRIGRYQEALIGILFVLASTAGVIILAGNPNSDEHLQNMLIGQILWTEYAQLWLPAVVGLGVLLLAYFRRSFLFGKGFYWVFAIAITSAVQIVGVFLVFASLILPAFGAVVLSKFKHPWLVATSIGVVAYTVGLALSFYTDLPAGPLIIWCMAVPILIGLIGKRGLNTPND